MAGTATRTQGAPHAGAGPGAGDARDGSAPGGALDAAGGGEGAGDGVRLRHEPALDGLRGLAVVAVVVFHLGRLQGGFLGVDLFFVLSGFLITSLLVVEHRHRGAIDLGRFWVRRARRLLPALFLVMVAIGVALLVLTDQGDRARFRGDALATLGYVANWHRMTAQVGYWDIFSVPSPLDHAWSLAIEEQFYVVWPLVAFLVLRRPTVARAWLLAGIAMAGAAASFCLLAVLWNPLDSNRAYFGTDTRIGPTLLGATLAIAAAHRGRRTGRPPVLLELLAAAALGWMTLNIFTVSGQGAWYYRGGLVTFSLAAVLVIATTTGGPPGLLARGLSWRPLRALGAISYGVYLWHWPVIVFLSEERTGLGQLPLDVLRVALTLALSVASYRLVERPIRRGALRGQRLRLRLTVAGATAATLAVALVATAGTPRPLAAGGWEVPEGGSDDPYLLWPEEIPEDGTKMLLVGDSGVFFLGPELVEAGEEAGITVGTSTQIGCTPINPEGVTRAGDGRLFRAEPCHDDRRRLWGELVDALDPDVVVYYLANGDLAAAQVAGGWYTDCDPPFDQYLTEALGRDARVLGRRGAAVVFATTPYVGWNEGITQRIDCRNATYQRVADSLPRGGTVQLNQFVSARQTAGVPMFRDPVHLSETGGAEVSAWLLPQVRAVADAGAQPPPPPPG